MIRKFKPDKYYKNIFEVDFVKLKNEGIKLIACDLDNTLVPHDVLDAPANVIELVNNIKDLGLTIIIMSNNSYRRVKRFCEELDIAFYCSCKKPLKVTFKKILADYDCQPSEFCLIGDQILTDIYGANGMKITSVFVEPLAQKDIIYTKVNRFFEKRIISKLEKRKIFKMGEYYG